ncbi:MAG: tRNA (N6-isopentenyl adenosine(37)-C2)-methylthiotransferase MiaB [Candidatus Staskawiczbacteria bacterium]|nr:tRNA (N6-isopentenyl adenosine(37)-C2)-methylthiotransferase MiaB [Candidatus Staskawiczbacteria bacterium]
MDKYFIITYGCQMNISDSERLSSVLEDMNYIKSSSINEADLIAVNMCSVRQTAVDRVHGLGQKFSKLKKQNQNIKTVLTGCILKKNKKKFAVIFDYVIDIKDIIRLPEILKISSAQKIREREFFMQGNYLDIAPKYSNEFSANVPIMTGCNNFCAYCVVPYSRDREISRPANEIIKEIKNLVKNDYKEIWLLGQNVNSYNGETPNPEPQTPNKSKIPSQKAIKFPKLLRMINNIPGNFWIRFTSSHPKDFSDELIKTMASCKKIMPYLNLPVQSGDNNVLKSMNRHYTVLQYKAIIKKIREAIPDISLSTDVIVGFPGETKKQFGNTAKLFREVKFDMAYINKYSPRPGTAASKIKDNVLPAEKKRREKILTKILKTTALSHNKKLIGKKITVLIDSQKNNIYFGKNEQYKTIKITRNLKPENKKMTGEFVNVKITKSQEWALEGRLIL